MKIIIVDDDCLVAGALKTILEANPDIPGGCNRL